MARKITWMAPAETSVTKVYIYRSTTYDGTYSELTNIDATSDGAAKSSSNTWVVTYTDSTGTRNHWYKIRFYDGTLAVYSEYSDAISTEEYLQLSTVAEVKLIVDTTGRWTDDSVFDKIKEVDDLIYIEFGSPLMECRTDVGYNNVTGTTQTIYYVGEPRIHRVDRVFYGTTTKTELFLEDEFAVDEENGMMRILPYASSSFQQDRTSEYYIRYVPKLYSKLSALRTAKALLEDSDVMSGTDISKELSVVDNKLRMVEQTLSNRTGVQLSSDVSNYDSMYGINVKTVLQDHDMNTYLYKYPKGEHE